MKLVERCIGCGRVVRHYGSFSVRLEEKYPNPITGELAHRAVIGKLCRKCASEAGYKVKGGD